MFGDDPDPMVTTVRVGFGTAPDSEARGRCTEQRGVSDHAIAPDNSGREEG